MASKQVELAGIGPVSLQKRKGAKTIRLSVTPHGQVRVTMPFWVPFEAGLQFARSRASWLQSQLENHHSLLSSGQLIGKMHRLALIPSVRADKITSRVTPSDIKITFPIAMGADHPEVQATASRASVRAMRTQADLLLPNRLKGLAMMHNFSYTSVQIKQLRGRWGSCDSHQNIVLNLFLMQLPWDLIDYVLIHELTHTEIMRHGPDFWDAMQRVLPEAKALRKEMRSYRPAVQGIEANDMANDDY